jgi:molybdenum-dependent DNA-binding transcriptional regulator ModE
MKRLVTLAVAVSLLLGTSVAWSQEGKPQPEQRRGGKPAMTARVDEQIKKLRALHERLTAIAATPAERQSAMDDARKEMQASITMLQRAPSPEANPAGEDVLEEVMPGRKGGGSGGGRGQGTAKRMEMMLMMIQLIVDQQALLAVPSASDSASRRTGTTAKSANKSAKASDAGAKK